MAKGVADNVIRIPCKASSNFFRHWFQFLTPFHHLTDREMEVAACLVKHRYELSKVILDNDLLDKVAQVFGNENAEIGDMLETIKGLR